MEYSEVKIGDLPHELNEAILQAIAMYTVAFLRVESNGEIHRADLLGSGVLVSTGNSRAILTAHHVVRELPRVGRLGILLEPTRLPHTVDTRGLAFVEIARGADDAIGPDLGAVILAPPIVSAIAAKKNFYNLDLQCKRQLQSPPELRDGAWFAQGFLEEGTLVTADPEGQGLRKAFYHFSGVGGPDDSPQIGDYDYFEFPVSQAGRPAAPRRWGGMSGGGLWQVPLKREGGQLVHQKPTLSGVVFYQQPTNESQCG